MKEERRRRNQQKDLNRARAIETKEEEVADREGSQKDRETLLSTAYQSHPRSGERDNGETQSENLSRKGS
jgi:hypothetical protein